MRGNVAQENRMKLRLGIALWLLVATVASGSAQWINRPDRSVPRLADGRPDLKAPAPRLPDGRLDLPGIWHPDTIATNGAAPQGQTHGEGPGILLKTEDGTPIPLRSVA